MTYPLPIAQSACPTDTANCSSYYFPGLFEWIADIPPLFSQVSDFDVLLLTKSLGLRVDCWAYDPSAIQDLVNDGSAPDNCLIFGDDDYAFEVCLGTASGSPYVWIACFSRLYACI